MLAAAEAVEMVGIDGAGGLGVLVEWTDDLVAGRQRQLTISVSGATLSAQVGDIVLVVLALDQGRIIDFADVLPGVVDIDVDRLFEHFRISGSGTASGRAGSSGSSR